MKGCCFIKFRDDAIFPLFFPSISFLPLFLNAIVLAFIPGLSYTLHSFMKEKKQQKEMDLLLRTEEGKDGLKELRGFHYLFIFNKSKQCSENEVEMFNRVGLGSEQKCKK